MGVSIALLHFPVSDKHGDVVTTSITNFDIHDLARAARTYGVPRYYIVTPVPTQKWFARRIIEHWSEGFGSTYNETRKDAMSIVRMADDLDEVGQDIEKQTGRWPIFVATSARRFPNTTSFSELSERIQRGDEEFCLIFGTGWGLHDSIMQEVDCLLEPIAGLTNYNHLSVRAAAAIILDRLLAGDRGGAAKTKEMTKARVDKGGCST